ncbi:MAG: hypothetical protein IT381_17275, partial [Deltaproteobacteria bacterium]|nr:hypothetical protein [Deltaproteobacteria bacterium]
MDAIIQADAAAAHLRIQDVHTNIRVNLGDGGVDTMVDVPLEGSLRLETPTCWQYKATDFSRVTDAVLEEEANKSEAKRLIKAGYAYLICVCHDQTTEKLAELNTALQKVVRKINPKAPTPQVLSAGQIARWASAHPAIVLRFFRSNLGVALAYDAWMRKERAGLPSFVELPERAPAVADIRAFIAATPPTMPVLSLRGPIGSGTSRLAAETLEACAPRVIFIADASLALRLATSLLNHPAASAILVVEHCPAIVRMRLADLLSAEKQRIRALVIDEPSELPAGMEVTISALESSDVQKVIDANFKNVPSPHRQAFVLLADGILKIAAQLAHAYERNPSGFLSDSSSWANDQLRRFVPDEKDRQALAVVSLFSRIGWSGESGKQFDYVCDRFSLDKKDSLLRLQRLAKAPGVTKAGPRYVSVRPRLFATPMFVTAWA